VRKDGRMLLAQLHEIKKENEMLKEFDDRFRKLVDMIPERIMPKDDAMFLEYMNTCEGYLSLMLRDKFPNSLEEAQDWARKNKENMLSSKVDALGSSEHLPLGKR